MGGVLGVLFKMLQFYVLNCNSIYFFFKRLQLSRKHLKLGIDVVEYGMDIGCSMQMWVFIVYLCSDETIIVSKDRI